MPKHDSDHNSDAYEEDQQMSADEQQPEEQVPEPQVTGEIQPERKKRPRGRPPGKKKQPKPEPPIFPVLEDDGNDEIPETEIDPEGEQKIDQDGHLKGGREYRFPTFTLPRHPTRLYLFSLDASKVLGFRDTYIFFLRNTNVKRVTASDEDREYMRDHGLLPSQLKSRAVTLVVARNLFRVHGHRIIKKGRPVRDDYFCQGRKEPEHYEESVEEEEMDYGLDLARNGPVHDGGPFKRHGPSILGFSNKVDVAEPFMPEFVPEELTKDQWMLKCALSAADFNSRLVRNRPTSFLDLHTNVEQVSQDTQPTRVVIQINKKAKLDVDFVEPRIAPDLKDDENWETVYTTDKVSMYPLAIMKEQFQDVTSVYTERFKDTDSAWYVNENETQHQNVPIGVPQHMYGVVPLNAPTAQKIQEKKPKPIAECTVCHSLDSPSKREGFPREFKLECSSCRSKYHPQCLDFDDPVLVAKILNYDWLCSNCKNCYTCHKPGNDDKLLFCDLCDKGFHTYCLTPALNSLPQGSWLCAECGECQSCSNKPHKDDDPSEFWHHVLIPSKMDELGTYLCTFCDPCHEAFREDTYCPLCLNIYKKDSDDEMMVSCDTCERWIHVGCDPKLTEDVYEQMQEDENAEFNCVLCDSNRLQALIRSRSNDTGKNYKIVKYENKTIVAPPLMDHIPL
ncbi:chromatin remodelling complex Rsc7/Swp82 subunit-domain-containing protein [Gorgonomyces haynaldii]|nr:chromatin remodelling complex Rsc7/Swp82 subunit-domain-containing protein [Gorgonomyces haynaldii]